MNYVLRIFILSNFIKYKIKLQMKNIIKNSLGKILITIQPKKASELLTKGMTIDMDLSRTDRLMRF